MGLEEQCKSEVYQCLDSIKKESADFLKSKAVGAREELYKSYGKLHIAYRMINFTILDPENHLLAPMFKTKKRLPALSYAIGSFLENTSDKTLSELQKIVDELMHNELILNGILPPDPDSTSPQTKTEQKG